MKLAEEFFRRMKEHAGITLNKIQQQAVVQTEGPLLLLASPGSGKTTTIIMRIAYLIEVKKVPPARIKAVTFSRAAANDMKARFRRLFPQLMPVDFSTIHSFAFEVVRDYLRAAGTPYRIIEGDVEAEDQVQRYGDLPFLHKRVILRKLYREIVGDNITDDQMDELTTYISYIKNKMVPDNRRASVKVGVPQAERIMREYEKFKQMGTDQLLLDYDDMLTICEQVLASKPKLLQKYQARYDYVLTDESQDTSLIQHAIIQKLVQKHRNLCVVADEDQSLYSWRGAEPAYLLNFKQNYPDAKFLYMEQNFRSTSNIVEAANQLIRRNKNRYDKNMYTHNPPGKPILIKSFEDYKSQAKYLVQDLQKISDLSDTAILYRNHSSSILLMNEFDRAGIPFYMKDGDQRFFSHWVVEDILNFMRMSYTDKRPDLLEKIHLKMNGYISKQQMAELMAIRNQQSVFDNLLQHVSLQPYQVQAIKDSQEAFRQMKGMPPRQAIHLIRYRLGYEKALDKLSEWMGFRKESLIGILNTLEEIAEGLATMEAFAERLKYLSSLAGVAKSRQGQNAVTLSTLHSSKGLEFERVYIIDLIEGILPSKEDLEDDMLMEEAVRLFYVGMTRAKRELELITYRQRDGEKTTESRLVTAVREIINPLRQEDKERSAGSPGSLGRGKAKVRDLSTCAPAHRPNVIRDAAQLREGAKIKHRVFGSGTILGIEGDVVHIQFSRQEKKLLLAACLEKGLLERV